MSKTLDQRLRDASVILDNVHLTLSRHPGRLPVDVENTFRSITSVRSDITHWFGLFEARHESLMLLDALETRADAAGNVPFGTTRIQYQHVRFIGVLAYITTTWALADRITGMVGQVLCTPEAGLNITSPAQLISHFIQRDRIRKTTAAALFESVRQTFGWPIGLSYAIRNHFAHDGAQIGGSAFFEGQSTASAFRISVDGWTRIEQKAQNEYRVESSYHRAGVSWPLAPRDDLREVLRVCEREMDDALGILLGSACNSLLGHVGFMLGED